MSKLEQCDVILLNQIDDLLAFTDEEQDKLEREDVQIFTIQSILYPDEV